MTSANEHGGCPCLYVEPCHPHCTCRTPVMSHGCRRCCRYGSIEQRTAMAAWIAKVVDEAVADFVYDALGDD